MKQIENKQEYNVFTIKELDSSSQKINLVKIDERREHSTLERMRGEEASSGLKNKQCRLMDL